MRNRFLKAFLFGLLLSLSSEKLYAGDEQNIHYLERGVYRIFTAAFQLPRHLFEKTFNGPIVLGTVDGALSGVYYSIVELTGGAFDIVRGVAPYAKYLVFFA